jgi:hypothetical protein
MPSHRNRHGEPKHPSGAAVAVHEMFTPPPEVSTSRSPSRRQGGVMGDLLAVVGTVVFVAALLGLVKLLERA